MIYMTKQLFEYEPLCNSKELICRRRNYKMVPLQNRPEKPQKSIWDWIADNRFGKKDLV